MKELFPMPFDGEEIERYSRQLLVKGWTLAAQIRLRDLKIEVSSELPLTRAYLEAAGAMGVSGFGDTSGEPDFVIESGTRMPRNEQIGRFRIRCNENGTVTDESTSEVFVAVAAPALTPTANSSALIPSAAQIFAALLVMRSAEVHTG